MSAYTYTAEPETVRLYTWEQAIERIKKIIKRKIRYYKKKVCKWLRETLAMLFMLFGLVVLPIAGMFLHWVMVGY